MDDARDNYGRGNSESRTKEKNQDKVQFCRRKLKVNGKDFFCLYNVSVIVHESKRSSHDKYLESQDISNIAKIKEQNYYL